MRLALQQARQFLGRTSPNPAVGAVLVVKDKVISRGAHRGPGTAHAEVDCLSRSAKPIPDDAVLYVTLEPCSTSGRTPPCTEHLISRGVRKVVFGAADPNPLHSGRAASVLAEAGLAVRAGVLAEECTTLNEGFNKWIVTKLPFVIVKCGMSLDGRLSRPPAENQWLTGAGAHRHVQKLRSMVDAILVGAETVRRDNPRLTVRGVRGAKQPWRIVLTRSANLPQTARIFTDRHAAKTLIFAKTPLQEVLRKLGEREITSVLIEGGGRILGEALDKGLADKAVIYLAPLFTGGPVLSFLGGGASSTAEASRLDRVSYERIGRDLCASGHFSSQKKF